MDASINLNGTDMQAMVEPWLDIAVPAVPFKLDGRIIESDGALALSSVTFNVDNIRVTLDGTTGLLPSLDGLKMTTSATGPDARHFVELFGELEDSALVPAAPFETRGSFSKNGTNLFIDSWNLRIGDSLMEMSGDLGDFASPAGIDVDFAASGPDLRLFVPESGIEVPVPYSVTGGMRLSETDIVLKEIDVRIAETHAWLDGTIPASAEMTNAEFDLRIAGPNLRKIGRAFDVQSLPAEAYRFEGSMRRSGDSYAIDNLIAEVGENDLGGKLGLEIGQKLRLTGQLESTYLNLAGLRAQSDDAAETEEDAPKSDRLIPDTPLPLQVLDLADVDVTLHLRKLVTDRSDVGDVKLNILMDHDELHVHTVEAALSNGGTLSAKLDVTHGGTLTGSLDLARTGSDRADVTDRLSAVGRQYRLRPPIDAATASRLTRPSQDLRSSCRSGATMRENWQPALTARSLCGVGKGDTSTTSSAVTCCATCFQAGVHLPSTRYQGSRSARN